VDSDCLCLLGLVESLRLGRMGVQVGIGKCS
jgi:hypothetical protein